MAETVRESVELICSVGELSGEVGDVVPIDSRRKERIDEVDPNAHPAKFVTVEIQSGWSKNKRNWPPEILDSIAKQVREKEPVGHKGHPALARGFNKGADFPDPQTVWLNAVTSISDKGKRLLVKGYNITDEIRRNLATGAVTAVSIFGEATMRVVKGGYQVEDFDLASIDWSPKGGQGMAGSVVALTGEQEGENESEDDDDNSNAEEGDELIVKPEDIANLTEGDLRKHNPDLAAQVEDVGEKRAESTLKEKVGEQEAAIEAAKPAIDTVAAVREKLGLKDDESITDAISKLVNDARAGLKSEFSEAVDKLLSKKIPDEKIRNLVRGLVGEMDSSVETEEDAEKNAEEKVNAMLDSNKETIKDFVGEMEEEDKPKKRTVSPANRYEDSRDKKEPKDTENIEHTTVTA